MTGEARERDELVRRALAVIAAPDRAARDALLEDLARYQARQIAPYGNLVRARWSSDAPDAPDASADRADGPASPSGWAPALPTDVFRYARIAGHDESQDVACFLTSGTTHGARGAHPFRDLTLYDTAARAHATAMLFPDVAETGPFRLVILAPSAEEAPESSLSYMLSRFAAWFGDGDATHCVRSGELDAPLLIEALEDAQRADRPVALLGTSFAFVFAEDALAEHPSDRRFVLPKGSRIMQTGGYKGRTREVDPETMRRLLTARYGVPEAFVIAEYGMTELSSQLYENTLRDAILGRAGAPRVLTPPGWVRATPVDPETLAPRAPGEPGVLRIDDVANVDSVAAILTSDLAHRLGDAEGSVVLHGRVPGAVPRGCSLSIEEALEKP